MYNNYTKIELLRWPAGWSVDGAAAAPIDEEDGGGGGGGGDDDDDGLVRLAAGAVGRARAALPLLRC